MAAANIFWGTMGSAAQYLFSSGSITPLALTMMRLVAAGVLLTLCASLVIPRQMQGFFRNWRDVRDIAVNGVLLFGAHSTFFEAVYYSNAGTGAILLTFAPLVTVLYFALAKHRPVAKREALCIALASAGVVLIVTNGSLTSLRFSPLAVLWGFVSACFYAAYTIQPAAVIRRVGTTPWPAGASFSAASRP